MKGFVQVYTGNGKGKTTAAFGLAVRAAGAGLNVFIAQFVKGQDYSELSALKRFDECIQLKQYGTGCFIFGEPSAEQVSARRDTSLSPRHSPYRAFSEHRASDGSFLALVADRHASDWDAHPSSASGPPRSSLDLWQRDRHMDVSDTYCTRIRHLSASPWP